MSNLEHHFVELDCNANTKIHLKSNQSIEVVCITYQTVVHFKHHKAEQTPANSFGVNDSLLQKLIIIMSNLEDHISESDSKSNIKTTRK